MNRFICNKVGAIAAAAVVVLGFAAPVSAADGKLDILNGKSARLIISGAPNSNNDRSARLFLSALKEKVPGMSIVAQNNNAAGGNMALSETLSAQGDAITLVTAQPGPIFGQLTGAAPMALDLTTFQWIGSMAGNQRLAISPKALSGKSFEDLKALGRPLVSLSNFAGSASETEAFIISAATGLPIRVITGFEEDKRTAMLLSGEADIILGTFDASVKALIDSGDVVPLFQIGGSPLPAEFSSVPALRSLMPKEAPGAIVDILESLNIMGRLVAAAPNTDPAVVEALRAAFDEVMADPAVIKTFSDAKFTVAPTSGAELQSRMNGLFGDTASVELLRKYIACGKKISDGETLSCGTN